MMLFDLGIMCDRVGAGVRLLVLLGEGVVYLSSLGGLRLGILEDISIPFNG